MGLFCLVGLFLMALAVLVVRVAKAPGSDEPMLVREIPKTPEKLAFARHHWRRSYQKRWWIRLATFACFCATLVVTWFGILQPLTQMQAANMPAPAAAPADHTLLLPVVLKGGNGE